LVGITIQLKVHQSQPNIYTLLWRFDLKNKNVLNKIFIRRS